LPGDCIERVFLHGGPFLLHECMSLAEDAGVRRRPHLCAHGNETTRLALQDRRPGEQTLRRAPTKPARQRRESARAAGALATPAGIRAAVAIAARGVLPANDVAATLIDLLIDATAAAADLARAAFVQADA
jgi:hypothetical protein